jgi:CRISPR-associated protein Cas5h
MSDEVLVFELSGRYAHFKVPETTRGAMSFPFPPRTALLGLLAGILGIERSSYWKEDSSLRKARIALEVLGPLQMYPMKVNYTQTKSDFVLGLPAGLRILIPSDPLTPGRRGFTTQYRLDMLRDPAYRVFVAIDDENLFQRLVSSIREHKYVYSPYLGHANLLAEVKFVGVYPFKALSSGPHKVTGLVPLSIVEIDSGSFVSGDFHIVHGVPMSMRVKEEIPSLDGRYITLTEPESIESVAFQVEGIQAPLTVQSSRPEAIVEVALEDATKRVVFLTGA